MAKITVIPNDRSFLANPGDNLFDLLQKENIDPNAVCGGKGTCGKCAVRVLEGSVKGSALPDGTFLACKTEITGDLTINIPTTKDAAARKSSLHADTSTALKVGIKKLFVSLPKPSIEDQCPDWERLLACLPGGINYQPALDVLLGLPDLLRAEKFQLTVVIRDNMVIGLEKGDTTTRLYGIAFDIGTTSVVAALLNLQDGKVLATSSVANPQRAVGADVITRIEYVNHQPQGSQFLKEKIVNALNGLIDGLLEISGVDRQFLYEVTIVGNTTMHHLFLGINPGNLATAPYIPAIKSAVIFPAEKLGLNLIPGAEVYILPNVAGFVGSDTVGVILAVGLQEHSGIRLAVDIGTNGEVALGSRDGILVCSTAAGPAFEGAQISCGMRAADGAIEGVNITADGLSNQVIGDTPLVLGICGSGLIQAIAEMLGLGIIDRSGKLVGRSEAQEKLSPPLAERIQNTAGGNAFVLVPENLESGQQGVYITQRDIREFQLAKGALAAGIQILMQEMNISWSDIEEVLLAGAFGSYIDKASARIVGLVPPFPLDKIKSVGNAAGMGARMALLSLDARKNAQEIAVQAKNVELSVRSDFQEAFMDAMIFPES